MGLVGFIVRRPGISVFILTTLWKDKNGFLGLISVRASDTSPHPRTIETDSGVEGV